MRFLAKVLLLLSACAEAPHDAVVPGAVTAAPMDLSPGRRTLSPLGRWEAVVSGGGALAVRPAGRFGEELVVDSEVDARLAIAADDTFLVYARAGDQLETDLWRVDLPSGRPVQVTAWTGSEDRPVLSPDGRRLAFVSGRTGIASWWVIDLPQRSGQAIAPEAGRQLSNVSLETAPRRPGVAPPGFLPVPDGTVYGWTAKGLSWVTAGRAYTLPVPP